MIFTCPSCKKETYDPWSNNWKVIEVGAPFLWGVKFCPECYEIHKDKELNWKDLRELQEGDIMDGGNRICPRDNRLTNSATCNCNCAFGKTGSCIYPGGNEQNG